jgi:hypothetical protein
MFDVVKETSKRLDENTITPRAAANSILNRFLASRKK